MKLPSLKVSIPFIFLCWCLVGVQVHGKVILAYPAMWAVVGLFFYGLHVLLRSSSSASTANSAATAGKSGQASVVEETPTDHQISASV